MTQVRVRSLSGKALDWAVGLLQRTNGLKPSTCSSCEFFLNVGDRDYEEYHCQHPAWGIGDSHDITWGWPYTAPGPDSSVSVHCPISQLTPRPYSTSWSESGRLVEEQGLSVFLGDKRNYDEPWMSVAYPGAEVAHGPTPLIAAMRAYVLRDLGETVNVPDELA